MTMADASLFDAFADDVPTAPKSQPAPRRSRKPAGQPRTRAPETDPDGGPEALPAWFLGDPDPAAGREFVVDGVLARGEVALLVGEPFAGKSALACRLAIDVAAGQPFLGNETRPAPVLYVAAERAAETRRRLSAAAAGLNPTPPVAVIGGRGDLHDPAWRDGLVETLRAVQDRCGQPVGLVVLDTMSRLTAGRDENGQGPASAAVDALQMLADAGPAVLVLHHKPKNSDGPRGSSAFSGGADAIFQVTKATEKSPAALKLVSSNLGPEGAVWRFTLDTAGDTVVARAIEAADAGPAAGAGRPGKAEARAAMVARILAEFAAAGAQPLERDVRDRFAELDGAAPEAAAKAWARLRLGGVFHVFTGLVRPGPDPKKSEAAS